jgi:uncharacterized membrane protein
MLKKSTRFSLIIFVLYTVSAFLIMQKPNYGNPEILAFLSAGILAILNLVLTVLLIEKNLAKNKNEFIKSFLQSTIIRVVILLAIFFTILLIMPLNHFVFSVAFFILYFLYQMIEIYILHTNKHSGN